MDDKTKGTILVAGLVFIGWGLLSIERERTSPAKEPCCKGCAKVGHRCGGS